jgi:hypothetical protein
MRSFPAPEDGTILTFGVDVWADRAALAKVDPTSVETNSLRLRPALIMAERITRGARPPGFAARSGIRQVWNRLI